MISIVPCNQGYRSKNIQLTRPDTHLAIYYIDVKYDTTEDGHKTVASARPIMQYPIYVYEDYNLDEFIKGDFEWQVLDYKKRVYYVMEENEDDEVISLLGMIYCVPESEPSFDSTGEAYFYFDDAEWDYRVEATVAFGKDFVYPISENRKDKEAVDEDDK